MQNQLGLRATSRGGAALDATDAVVVITGNAAADTQGGINFGPHLTASLTGQENVFGEDLGDQNRTRDQGQIIVQGTTVRDSLQFGLVADAANRVNNLPVPGSVRNLPTLNADQESNGVVFMNNLLIDNETGGIHVSGDGLSPAPDVFSRLINNTIYGGTTGILIDSKRRQPC